ncbi:ribosomal-processing cysteine protease Prp [Peptoniphilus catoniae]|uniref:ribosomal-processing cysteine protease Prp n=1 Tax=Peptoniphilus catoniae TaxID=1660341 RepID=UPI0010FDD6FA|nr:ribosomal-processing cysteine protease Prp [Peptoniphilus catoniae]
MITVEVFTKNNLYIGLKSKGHAYFSDKEDIVCAGVSTLTQTLYFYIKSLGISDKDMCVKQNKGYLYLRLFKHIEKQSVQSGFSYMITGLKLLEADYSKYIKLKITEVRDDKV